MFERGADDDTWNFSGDESDKDIDAKADVEDACEAVEGLGESLEDALGRIITEDLASDALQKCSPSASRSSCEVLSNRSASRSRSPRPSSSSAGVVPPAVGGFDSLLPTAKFQPQEPPVGTSHYVDPIWAVLMRDRLRLPVQSPQWLVESLCSGTGAESEAHVCMAIPTRVLGYADRKPIARKWLLYHWSGHVDHIFEDVQAYVDGGAYCYLHHQNCKCSPSRPHVSIGGLPCPPWSRARQKSGRTARTGAAEHHPAFDTVFRLWGDYLDSRKPHTFWIEEVDTFMNEPKDGSEAPVIIFMRMCVRRGYATRSLLIDNCIFSDGAPRRRCYVLGIGRDCGHSQGADWVMTRIQDCIQHRKLGAATPLENIVAMFSVAEVARRAAGKVAFCCFV